MMSCLKIIKKRIPSLHKMKVHHLKSKCIKFDKKQSRAQACSKAEHQKDQVHKAKIVRIIINSIKLSIAKRLV